MHMFLRIVRLGIAHLNVILHQVITRVARCQHTGAVRIT